MTTSVTKQAFARGVGEYLQRTGVTSIPTPELLKHACAIASDDISVEPAFYPVPHEDCIKVASHLAKFSEELRSTGKFANHGVATIGNSEREAYGDMLNSLLKVAMQTGSTTITGDRSDQQNLLTDSYNAEKVLDAHRPEGYAVVGQGNTNLGENETARIGQEQPHPLAPSHGGAAANSVVAASTPPNSPSSAAAKSASIHDKLRKLAAGMQSGSTTIDGEGTDKQNLLSDSPSGEAAMDRGDRPENYANVGQGNANIKETESANVGEETDHPNQPMHGGASANSVTEASKQASARWERHFRETAADIVPKLPENMPYDQKVAAVKACMSLEPHETSSFLQKTAAAWAPKPEPANTVASFLDGLTNLNAQG